MDNVFRKQKTFYMTFESYSINEDNFAIQAKV